MSARDLLNALTEGPRTAAQNDALVAKVLPADQVRPATHALYTLAGLSLPGTTTGHGASVLESAFDGARERFEDTLRLEGADALHYDLDDDVHEVADSAVPVYTADVWRAFADLQAWNEDPSDLLDTSDGIDLTDAARVALYLPAHRLATALVEEWRGALTDYLDDLETKAQEEDEKEHGFRGVSDGEEVV